MQERSSDPLPIAALETYLSSVLPGFSGPMAIEKTSSGQSNPTFILSAKRGKYVLRRKPDGVLLPAAHAIDREFRVMAALADTNVVVPEMLHYCDDESILGAEFFLMSHVQGLTLNDPRCPELSLEVRKAVYQNVNRMLARLHAVDPKAVGLSDFGRPGNYFSRQLSRWTKQYRASETDNISEMETLISWLEEATPPAAEKPALVHGDWRLDNLLVDGETGAVRAIVDWELSTLGHPHADLAGQLMQWAMPAGEVGRGLAGVDRASLGLPSDREYVELYARNAGLSEIPDLSFPIAFSFFRMGAILQGVKKRALDGNASNPEKALRLGAFVPLFAQTALEHLNVEA